MGWLDRQRTRYVLRHHPIDHQVWEELLAHAPIFHGLSSVERSHLRKLTTLFIHRKTFTGAHDLLVSTEMVVAISAQACLLVLNLSLNDYAGWSEIVIYPGAFRVSRGSVDSAGLVSNQTRALSGESWLRGPVILSWDDVAADLNATHGADNVVVHEFAHKLDMRNGRANGMPALHADMRRARWTEVFADAFEHLQRRVAHHHRSVINAYAATDPAEFFAVASELFFTNPEPLDHEFPLVYKQLTLFYRQDPLSRMV